MAWDITKPAGTDSIRDGDNSIREMKVDLTVALGQEGVFPGADPVNPKFYYTPPRGNTGARPTPDPLLVGRLYLNTDTKTVQRDNGTTWDDETAIAPIEAGTKMIFFQAAAPTGWTIDAGHDDKALRVVSASGGGSGGTDSISSPPTHTHTGVAHTHSLAPNGATANNTDLTSAGIVNGMRSVSGFSGGSNTGLASSTDSQGGGATGATAGFSPKYIDVIVATKD